MNPKLKKALGVLAAVVAVIGVIYLALRGIAYVIARTLTRMSQNPDTKLPAMAAPELPIGETIIVSLLLFMIGWSLVAHFEYTNKTIKTAGFVIFLMGCAGFLTAAIAAVIISF